MVSMSTNDTYTNERKASISMDTTRKTLITLAAALGVLGGGFGIASATSQTSPTENSPGVVENDGNEPAKTDETDETDEKEETDDDVVDPARAAEAVLTAEDAEAAAIEAAGGGTTEPAELEDEDGELVYEVEITADDGTESEVTVNAIDGTTTVEIEDDDEEDDDEDGTVDS